MSILKAFTGHLMEFVNEIKKVFPEDADLRTGYFFLEGSQNKGKLLKTIDSFRERVRNMGEENKNKSIKYVQNLTKLCSMYYQNK